MGRGPEHELLAAAAGLGNGAQVPLVGHGGFDLVHGSARGLFVCLFLSLELMELWGYLGNGLGKVALCHAQLQALQGPDGH